MGLDATKPVLEVSDKTRLNSVSSATETSLKIEISLVSSLAMILSNKWITKALIRLRGLCCSQTPKAHFLASRPIYNWCKISFLSIWRQVNSPKCLLSSSKQDYLAIYSNSSIHLAGSPFNLNVFINLGLLILENDHVWCYRRNLPNWRYQSPPIHK